MKFTFCVALVLGFLCTLPGQADVITPVGALATSEFGAVDVFGDGNFSDVFVTDLIDGGGLNDINGTPDDILDDVHDFDFSSTNGWHSGDFAAGISGGVDGDGDPFTAAAVDAQIVEFDLGGLYSVASTYVWQQNQGLLFFPPAPAEARGVDEFEILTSASTDGDDFVLLGKFQLQPETGLEEVPAQVITFDDAVDARRIRFHFLSAISGEPNEFVGLSEVRFVGAELGTLGDFNNDGQLTVDDINLLNAAIRAGGANSVFDVTTDGNVDEHDRDYWVNELKRTWYGDANLDGVFDTTDFVEVFQAGQYEDGLDKNSLWQTGDWNGDGEFDSGDFVTAFQGGGFEQGPRAAVAAVPEPSSCVLFLLGSAAIRRRCRVATKVVNRGSQSG